MCRCRTNSALAGCSTDGRVAACKPDAAMEPRDSALLQTHCKMSESTSFSTIAPEDLEVQDFHEEDELPVEDLLSEYEIVEAFKAFDENGDGFTCLQDIRRVLLAAGMDFSDGEFDEATGSLTVDAIGQVNIMHFADAFLENDSQDRFDQATFQARACRGTRSSGAGTKSAVVREDPVDSPDPSAFPRVSFGTAPDDDGCFCGMKRVLRSLAIRA